VADHRFDYPSAAAPSVSLTFPRGGPMVADAPRIVNHTVTTRRTQDGDLLSWARGSGRRVYPYTIRFLMSSATETDLDDVISFIDTTAQWSHNAFDWTDSAGTVRRVRIINDPASGLSFEVFGTSGTATVMSTTLMLEVVS
jgi:hypothetical protein